MEKQILLAAERLMDERELGCKDIRKELKKNFRKKDVKSLKKKIKKLFKTKRVRFYFYRAPHYFVKMIFFSFSTQILRYRVM